MGIPDGAHTHGRGGSGPGTAILVIVGAALAVKAAGPVVAAVGELVHVLLVVVAVVAGVAGACLVAAGAWRLYRWHHEDSARTLATPPAGCGPLSPSHRRSTTRSGRRRRYTCTCTGYQRRTWQRP
jgi:hypothetical protein